MSPRVILKPQRAQPFFGRHPWVYAGAIDRIEGEPADGDEVELRSQADNFIARGLFNSQSKLRVRLYSWDDRPLDESFFRERIRQGIHLRHDILKLNSGPAAAYRVVFSESDFLSGLIVDRYGDWLAMQCTARAIGLRTEMLCRILVDELHPKGIVLRTEKGISKLEGLDLRDGPLWGESPPTEVIIEQNNLRFAINLGEGQKTGFYLDQRDNRVAAAHLASGRRVLDAFCYSGGFGLHCARAGAASVECLDSSASAIALAKRNAELNHIENVTFTHADVFQELSAKAAAGTVFDLIVLDPPKFARDRKSLPVALRGYRRLHQIAFKLLATNAILVSCCCTGLITMTDLEEVILQTALDARRDVQILERRGPSADHPVSITCRETGYLKCLFCRVA